MINIKYDYYLDLSSTNTGVVLVPEDKDLDILVTSWDFSKFKCDKDLKKTEKQLLKLKFIGKFIQEFKKEYEPKDIYLEGIFVQSAFRGSSEVLLKLHGVLIQSFLENNISYIPPSTIKMIVAGKGNVPKAAVLEAVKEKGLTPRNNDESDAFALALTVFETQGHTFNIDKVKNIEIYRPKS